MNAELFDQAISEYSSALSLDFTTPGLFIKRSETYAALGSWKDALDDANKVSSVGPYELILADSVIIRR